MVLSELSHTPHVAFCNIILIMLLLLPACYPYTQKQRNYLKFSDIRKCLKILQFEKKIVKILLELFSFCVHSQSSVPTVLILTKFTWIKWCGFFRNRRVMN